jgi:hypothetical protein
LIFYIEKIEEENNSSSSSSSSSSSGKLLKKISIKKISKNLLDEAESPEQAKLKEDKDRESPKKSKSLGKLNKTNKKAENGSSEEDSSSLFSNNAKGEAHKQILSPIKDNSEQKIEESENIVKHEESLASLKFSKLPIVLKESNNESKNDIRENESDIQKVSSQSQSQLDEEFKNTNGGLQNLEIAQESESNDKFIDNNEFSTWYKDENF